MKELIKSFFAGLDNGEYNGDYLVYEGIDKIVSEWTDNKRGLKRMFEKHPDYNGNGQIVQLKSFIRDIDRPTFIEQCYMLKNWADDGIYMPWDEHEDAERQEIVKYQQVMFLLIRMAEDEKISQYITDEMKESILEIYPDMRIHKGQKLSRFLYNFISQANVKKPENFESVFAKLSDSLNPTELLYTVVMSINPIDYYTMSNGNTWTSCHNLGLNDRDKGCYSSGTESYMLDDVSFVVYTLDGDWFKGEHCHPEKEQKIHRQMWFYNDNLLIQSRLYPDNDNKQFHTFLADCVTEAVSVMNPDKKYDFGLVNVDNHTILDYLGSAKGKTHYEDYLSRSYRRVYTSGNKFKKVIIGHKPICPNCGDTHSRTTSIMCRECTSDEYYICPNCDSEFVYDDCYIGYSGDYYCCSECAEECDDLDD